ncbi:MAG: hypothetical protein ACJAVR_000734 [Paracoccaceae bacterium]|jgi:hypothetical protein
MLGDTGRRLASLIVFLMIFTASCKAFGVNGAPAATLPAAQATR